MKTALSIAGFDPSGGAGIVADMKVFHYLGTYGLSIATALTAQNTVAVESVQAVGGQFLKKQLNALLRDFRPDSTKIGMVCDEENIGAISAALVRYSLGNIVLDPVLISSSGKRLAKKNVPELLIKKILPLCTVITPNIQEASVLSGISINSVKDMEKAAVVLKKAGPHTVIITGGHLRGIALDTVFSGDKFHYLKARKRTGEYHGTGCMFSAAIAAFLAQGCHSVEAAKKAKEFMEKAFQKTFSTGRGMRLLVI
jgi:hydroxymethylpyrimidine/phosphomethylpyrimidine kinase